MRLIASSLMAGLIALGAVSPAFADPPRYNYGRDYDRGRDRDRNWDRDWNDRDYRHGYRDGRHDDRWDDRRHYKNGYKDGYRKWHRGDRFDRRVHYNYVVVNDYNRYYDHRGYRLPPPRHGHYYVRDDRTGDILLIAAATGLILWALND